MAKTQAIIIRCPDERLTAAFSNFVENQLNLYAIDEIQIEGPAKIIFDAGGARDGLFANLQMKLEQNHAPRLIVLAHTDCAANGGSQNFNSPEEEISELALKLRHSVSALHATFPNQQVEAYLAILKPGQEIVFSKII